MAKVKLGKWEYSHQKLNRQLAQAAARGKASRLSEPRARSAEYDRDTKRIVVELDNGTSFAFPPDFVEELVDASASAIADISIEGRGSALHWDSLDLDLGVPELMAGIYGTRRWMAKLGQKGGRVTSEAKAAAARDNGKKGGRPRGHTP